MSKPFFNVLHVSGKSKARIGEIHTEHGVIKTPAFVPVATKGTLKSLPPLFIPPIGIQVSFVNTYHLAMHPGVDIIDRAGGIQEYSKLIIPLMSDSGGFQVFSLAHKDKKSRKARVRGEEEPLVLKITDDGVTFRSTHDGAIVEFTPEKSMEYQRKIGADIIMAFDECLQPDADERYAERSMKRTHQWLERCIKFKSENDSASLTTELGSQNVTRTSSCGVHPNHSPHRKQYLYGIIQGGRYRKLREESAEFVVSQNTPGVAIGGVAVGETKKEMREEVAWIAPFLPKDRPVHLLGIGQFDDILDLVLHGIDTFDCVEPTRLARMGTIYQSQNNSAIDIIKTLYKDNLSSVDEYCGCYVCKNFSKSYLHHLFKQKEILGYTLATYHNLSVMERFFDRIRNSISQDLI